MKTRMFLLAAAAAALAGCAQNEVIDIPQTRAIGFDPYVGNTTRAAANDTALSALKTEELCIRARARTKRPRPPPPMPHDRGKAHRRHRSGRRPNTPYAHRSTSSRRRCTLSRRRIPEPACPARPAPNGTRPIRKRRRRQRIRSRRHGFRERRGSRWRRGPRRRDLPEACRNMRRATRPRPARTTS